MESRMQSIHLAGDKEDKLVLDDGSIQFNDVHVDLCLMGWLLIDQSISLTL